MNPLFRIFESKMSCNCAKFRLFSEPPRGTGNPISVRRRWSYSIFIFRPISVTRLTLYYLPVPGFQYPLRVDSSGNICLSIGRGPSDWKVTYFHIYRNQFSRIDLYSWYARSFWEESAHRADEFSRDNDSIWAPDSESLHKMMRCPALFYACILSNFHFLRRKPFSGYGSVILILRGWFARTPAAEVSVQGRSSGPFLSWEGSSGRTGGARTCHFNKE